MKLRILSLTLLVLIFCEISVFAKEWKEYKRQHFIIYYNEAPLSYVETVEDAAERYYREIADNLGFTRHKSWSWDDRAIIYIYSDLEHYVKSGKKARW